MKSFDLETVKQAIANNSIPSNHDNSLIVDEFAKSVIDKVFNELSVIFPAWKNAWPTNKEMDMAKLQWTKAFVENNICSIEQIQYGFKKARQSGTDFLPSCGKFISWCEPSPEDLGYPEEQQAKRLCVAYRSNKKLGLKMNVRPLIVELTKNIDWWLLETAGSQNEHKKADKHFKEEYMALINSGYKEPVESDLERLETKEVVNERMSPEHKKSSKERGLEHLKAVKDKLKQNKFK